MPHSSSGLGTSRDTLREVDGLSESRVGHETVRDVEFKPQDFTRRIRIFLAAFIALDNERSADWKGFESVCLGQRNLVPNHQIRFPMSLRVLADYDPAVVRISHGPDAHILPPSSPKCTRQGGRPSTSRHRPKSLLFVQPHYIRPLRLWNKCEQPCSLHNPVHRLLGFGSSLFPHRRKLSDDIVFPIG